MPPRTPRPCRSAHCPRLTVERAGYCDKHRHTGWEDHQRGRTTTQRGYGSDWEKIKPVVLERDSYLCQPCKRQGVITPAQAVDHIKAKAHGGSNVLTNLEAICIPCHNKKTAQDRAKNSLKK